MAEDTCLWEQIKNNNGVNCYLPPASGNILHSQRLQVNERSNSEIKCDILMPFSIEIAVSNS